MEEGGGKVESRVEIVSLSAALHRGLCNIKLITDNILPAL